MFFYITMFKGLSIQDFHTYQNVCSKKHKIKILVAKRMKEGLCGNIVLFLTDCYVGMNT